MADDRKAQMKHEKLERKKGHYQTGYISEAKKQKQNQLIVRLLMTPHHNFVLIASI